MIISNYVAEDKIKSIFLGLTEEQARDKYDAVHWSYNWWYPVEKLPAQSEVVYRQADAALEYPYNTDEWVLWQEVKRYWPYSRQRFFQVAGEDIRRIEVTLGRAPFWIYNKGDIKTYLLNYAVEGRLRNAVSDIENFIEEIKAW